jgi:hypothetical protein
VKEDGLYQVQIWSPYNSLGRADDALTHYTRERERNPSLPPPRLTGRSDVFWVHVSSRAEAAVPPTLAVRWREPIRMLPAKTKRRYAREPGRGPPVSVSRVRGRVAGKIKARALGLGTSPPGSRGIRTPQQVDGFYAGHAFPTFSTITHG